MNKPQAQQNVLVNQTQQNVPVNQAQQNSSVNQTQGVRPNQPQAQPVCPPKPTGAQGATQGVQRPSGGQQMVKPVDKAKVPTNATVIDLEE